MAKPLRKRCLSAEARRALKLLSRSPDGVEALLLAHGFTRQMLTGFIRSGLATWRHKTMRAGGRTIDSRQSAAAEQSHGQSSSLAQKAVMAPTSLFARAVNSGSMSRS